MTTHSGSARSPWRSGPTLAACLALTCATLSADGPGQPEDMPGYRPESAHAAAFLDALPTATIAIHPTIVRRASRTAASYASQEQAIALLDAADVGVIAGNVRHDLGPLIAGSTWIADSQWALFQFDLERVADAVRGRQTAATYHLTLELLLPVTDDEIFGVECYIVDQQGNNVFSFLLNAHHRAFTEAQLYAADGSEAARDAMIARATDAAIGALLRQVAVARNRIARAAAREAAMAAGDFDELVFDDFDTPMHGAPDPYGIAVGFRSFTDGDSTIEFTTTDAHPPRPGEAQGNRVLRADMNVDSWVAFGHFFEFEDPQGPFWMPYDWRAFDGIAFWLHGAGTGATVFIDIIDNRGRNPSVDNAERHTYALSDDVTGWRRISIPFSEFERKEIYNGAPRDGLGLSSVHGWAIGASNTKGPVTWFVDDVSLQRVGPPREFAPEAGYAINELPMYGGRDKTPEQRRADAAYIDMMTARGRSREEAAEVAAKNAWYVLFTGDGRNAIKRFNQAWLLDPDNRLALWGFAVICVDRGLYDEAARYYRMAIENGPPDPRLERDYRLALRQLEKVGPVIANANNSH